MTAKIFIYNAQGTGYHKNPAAEKAFTDAITPLGPCYILGKILTGFITSYVLCKGVLWPPLHIVFLFPLCYNN